MILQTISDKKSMVVPSAFEAVEKLNDLGSPRANEGEGLGVRGVVHSASSPEERLKKRSK